MIITLLRKPLEGSVAENTLKHGCGAINIDATRIDSGREVIKTHSQSRKSAHEDKKIYSQFKGDMETHQTKGQEIGRWPANFVLTHKEGCEIKGTKKVKSGTACLDNKTKVKRQAYGDFNPVNMKGKAGYAGEDGKEEVVDWDCVEDCPVKELDQQSGHQKSGVAGSKSRAWGVEGKEDILFKGGWRAYGSEGYKDEGGASRFFKQFKTKDDQ